MKQFWKVLKRFAAPYKRYLAGSVILNLLSAVFNIFSFALLIPILNILFKMDTTVYEFMPWDGMPGKDQLMNNMYWYVSQLIARWGGSTTLLILGCIFGGMTLLKTSCYFASSAVMVPLRTGIVRDIRTMVYNKLLSLPMGFFNKQKKGDIIARMSGDVNEIENSIISSLDMLIKNPILIICYFSALIYFSWELTLFTLTVVPAMAWGMSAIGKKLKRKSLEAQEKWSETMAQLDETLGGLRVIKAFIAEDKMKERFAQTANEYKKASGKVAVRQASAHPVSELLGSIMIMIVLWFGGTLILSEKAPIDASTFIYYMTILYSVLAPLKEFSRASYNIPKGLASMERVDKIMNAVNDITEPAEPENIEGFNEEICFKGVSFSYEDGKEVLHEIDLTIPKGKTVALVGQSGSGKSTLVDLIPRYYDVDAGSITLDGKDIRNLRVKDLRSLIGNVNQEAILFNDTIFNNIAFGVEGATMEQVVAAAKIANAHEFIIEKEDGYQTNIGDRGGKLSGGQRQRISIARAILKNPPVLILDEATSALDTESEKIVQEALDRLTSTRTTIAIAHRLSTIRNADEIC
ncbi:MAG: ABC transporter ATP-binding protein, partial [Bacteroidales bacterium]|nr:ABC transporter ATP-binding protein [Bacteroidales bacterium]